MNIPMKFKIKSTLVACLILVSTPSIADEIGNSPPSSPAREGTADPRHEPQLISEITFGAFMLELEKTTLDQVIEVAGSGHIEHRGDAGETKYWVCFSDSRQKIWISSSELGGANHVIDGIHVFHVEREKDGSSCPNLPTKMKPILFNKMGLLGLHKIDISNVLGKPLSKINDWWIYSITKPAPFPGFDRTSNLSVCFINNRAASIVISQSTTN